MKKTKDMEEVNWPKVWFRGLACVIWLMTAATVLLFGMGIIEMASMVAEYGMFYAVLAFCLFTFSAGLLVLGVGAGVWLWRWMWEEVDW